MAPSLRKHVVEEMGTRAAIDKGPGKAREAKNGGGEDPAKDQKGPRFQWCRADLSPRQHAGLDFRLAIAGRTVRGLDEGRPGFIGRAQGAFFPFRRSRGMPHLGHPGSRGLPGGALDIARLSARTPTRPSWR
ncbi:unnamed protein product [Prorocentrum cordatum]|uniref:Uncharacterized protein n=1 Tax=Prorocentrum cordatum TaxID=2364126 RepID=A0ABN9SSQ6_9DINO|nr:unnamed protein product [Polarella glacialis]